MIKAKFQKPYDQSLALKINQPLIKAATNNKTWLTNLKCLIGEWEPTNCLAF